jgi:HSP20 family molecular chaperone IbpA
MRHLVLNKKSNTESEILSTMVITMKDKKEREKDEFPKELNEEFRSVRFYSNIDGVEKEYGYDYKRDADGKEEYRELGEIPEEYGKEFFDKIHSLERSFNWDNDFFTRSFERFASIFPGLDRLIGNVGRPRLVSGAEENITAPVQEEDTNYEVAYDLQVDKDTNELYLIVELPGFAKEHVNLKLVKQGLKLEADNGKKQIDTKVPIQYQIDKEKKISATMKNGILEVKLKLLETENGDGTDIPIN